jgi:LysM repeat protein
VTATLLVIAFSIGRASSSATNHAGRTNVQHAVVQPGDTLWVIARRAVPDADPRITVQRIVDLNGLTGTAVVPGQQLALPSR